MALRFPATIMTYADRLAYLMRLHRLMILKHQEQRARYPAKMSDDEIREFKLWERTTWHPRMKVIGEALCQYRDVHLSRLGDVDVEVKLEAVRTLKTTAETDTRFDGDATKEMPADVVIRSRSEIGR